MLRRLLTFFLCFLPFVSGSAELVDYYEQCNQDEISYGRTIGNQASGNGESLRVVSFGQEGEEVTASHSSRTIPAQMGMTAYIQKHGLAGYLNQPPELKAEGDAVGLRLGTPIRKIMQGVTEDIKSKSQ